MGARTVQPWITDGGSSMFVVLSCAGFRFSVDEIKVLKRNYEEGKQKVDKARPHGCGRHRQ